MLSFIGRRIAGAIPTLLVMSFIAFGIVRLIPGDPAAVIAGPTATPAEVERVRSRLGLDLPFHQQLIAWYANALHGDLGNSILLGRSVVRAIAERLPVTLSLAALAMLWTALFGIAAGVIAAVRALSWVDQTVLAVCVLGVSLPNFGLALLLIELFSVDLGWLPTGGYVALWENPAGWARSLILPSIALALPQIAIVARTTRATMLEVLRQDYIRTAHAKGLPRAVVIERHALKNAMVAVLTVLGVSMAILISGSVVIESVFSLPGLGRLLATSILTRDYPVIQGGLLLVATALVALNLAIDLIYMAIDPRLRP